MAVNLYYPSPVLVYLPHAYQTAVMIVPCPQKAISKQLTYFNKTRYECYLKAIFLILYKIIAF